MERINRGYLLIGLVIATILFFELAAHAARVSTDYDHSVNFEHYRTYSWAKVETASSLWDTRVKDAVSKELAAKGWSEVPSGGDAALVAVETTRTRQQLDTLYDGFGGRRWGGFGEATTTVERYKVGTLVVDMFDAGSKKLIWRAASQSALSGNPEKDTKNLDKEVQKMFQHFPPEATS
jgi:hypothetical protein